MKKSILVLFLVAKLFGSMIVFIPNAGACHNKTVTIKPGTEQDITDYDTYMVEYEIDVKCTPGCGNQYWVGFTADAPPNGWARDIYKKGDTSKTSILGTGTPPDGDHNNWDGWISAGSGSEVHFVAILWVKVVNTQMVDNGESATITVHCWSCDNVPNDREDDPVTTVTTLNIPHGIRLKHTTGYLATREVQPGETAEFNLRIKDIGNASGVVDLSKSPMSHDCFDDDWAYELPASKTLLENSTVDFTLKVTPPLDAQLGDFAIFVIHASSQADPLKYYHTVAAKTVIMIPLPDLSVKSSDIVCKLGEDILNTDDEGKFIGISDGETVDFYIDVYNLGETDVNNFDVTFKLTDVGNEKDLDTKTVSDTLAPTKKTTLKFSWVAEEGVHSLCFHPDEKELIDEMDEEGNNEAGVRVSVGPPKPKNIVISNLINPSSCMPGGIFTISGTANYNPEYDSLPVENGDVTVKIVESDDSFTGKTNSKGEYSIECTAPSTEGKYHVDVTVKKDSISNKVTEALTVSTFQINVLVSPRTVITGEEVIVSGRVTENEYGVSAADISVMLLDKDNKQVLTSPETDQTDNNGMYDVDIKSAPAVTEYSEFTVEVTATKGEITGTKTSVLFVDIDTDSDGTGNQDDTDDDNDNYPDTIENPYGTDPLDATSMPTPVADAGSDLTVNEGEEVTLDGGESYSPASLSLVYTWDLGDGTDSTEESFEHTYDQDGEYEVTLVVSDEYGGSDTANIKVTVNDLSPTAKISGPTEGEVNVELTYKATDIVENQDKIIKYEWDLDDDGEYDKEGKEITYPWTKADTYTITLRITDSDGSTYTSTFDVEITAKKGGESDTESASGAGKESTNYAALYVVLIIIIVVVILVALFMMRKKKPASTPPEQRVAANQGTQQTRRPTTQFADADIKPAIAPTPTQSRQAVPGTVPQRPAFGGTAPQQPAQLPPGQRPTQTQQPQQTPGYQTPPQEQRDWSWNINE